MFSAPCCIFSPIMRPALASFILLSLLAAPAQAQQETLVKAKALFLKAEIHYRLEEFQKALALYRSAYKLADRPHLLFNVAQCHRQLGKRQQGAHKLKNLEHAVFYYRLYLSDWKRAFRGASPRNTAEVQRHIKVLSAATTRLKEQLRKERQEQLRRQREQKIPASGRKRWKRPWAWITVGAGVAAVGAGAALLATRRVDELVWRPPTATEPGKTPYRVTDSVAPGAILLGVGVAAGMAATYLFARSERPASATVSVTPGGAWVGVSGSF